MRIRTYNFAIPGNTDRHIPGIPGLWPAGSIVSVDEETSQVVSTVPADIQPVVPRFLLEEEKQGVEPEKEDQSTEAPAESAEPEKPVQASQPLADILSISEQLKHS